MSFIIQIFDKNSIIFIYTYILYIIYNIIYLILDTLHALLVLYTIVKLQDIFNTLMDSMVVWGKLIMIKKIITKYRYTEILAAFRLNLIIVIGEYASLYLYNYIRELLPVFITKALHIFIYTRYLYGYGICFIIQTISCTHSYI